MQKQNKKPFVQCAWSLQFYCFPIILLDKQCETKPWMHIYYLPDNIACFKISLEKANRDIPGLCIYKKTTDTTFMLRLNDIKLRTTHFWTWKKSELKHYNTL